MRKEGEQAGFAVHQSIIRNPHSYLLITGLRQMLTKLSSLRFAVDNKIDNPGERITRYHFWSQYSFAWP